MFRKMRRNKQQLDVQVCKDILKNEWRGVLSLLGDNDYPYGMPMNFYYDESEHKLYFHGSKVGHRIDAINAHNKASFCVYTQTGNKENHWSLNFHSVILFGEISIVKDREIAKNKVLSLAHKYFPKNAQEELKRDMNAHFDNAECLVLNIKHMSGKLVNES